MRSFLLLYSEVSSGGGAWDGDPAALGIKEHYNELTWVGSSPNETWTDAKSFSKGWPDETGARTSSTQNGLKTMVNPFGTTYWTADTTGVPPYSSLTTSTDHTAFYVMKWGTGDNDTMAYHTGSASQTHRQKSSAASGGWYAEFHTGSQGLALVPAFSTSSNRWDVWCLRLTNTTNAGVLDGFHFQNAKRTATNANWTAINLTGASNSFLCRNNTASEPWQGTLAEIVIFDKLLTDDECQSINAFLTTKWGITAV